MSKGTIYFITLGFIIATVGSCISYNRVSLNGNDPFQNSHINENFPYYNVYIHDKEDTYRLQNPNIKDDIISGNLEQVTSEEEIKEIKETAQARGKNKHKYDLNIYTKKPIGKLMGKSFINKEMGGLAMQDSSLHLKEGANFPEEYKFQLRADDIDKVEAYAQSHKSIGTIVLFILLGLLAILLLVWGLVALTVHGSNESGNASGTSNSNSNSDGSCYIATMVYGSYDAPEVMVLRSFRDNFLAKYYLGRKFVIVYYRYSPYFVERFKYNKTVHKPIRYILNKFIQSISDKF